MKNHYLKKVFAASAALIAFIGIQHPALAAMGEPIEEGKVNVEEKEDDVWFEGTDEPMVVNMQSSRAETQISSKKELPDMPALAISENEKDLFNRLVEAEAKGESYKGKVAVATVVLNRVESEKFPDTVTGVIKQVVGKAYAFSPVQNGQINKPASEEAKRAVDEALTRKDRLNDSVYFYNPDIATDQWIRTRTVVATIGNHVFAK